MTLPIITVITVCYNTLAKIEKTIQSVINQSYPNIEYIIIDGGSNDGTTDIIRKYQDKVSYWTSEPDNGIYDAMNKGILKSSGEWIIFMNCGDYFYNNDVLNEIFNGKIYEEDIIYGNSTSYSQDGTINYFISGEKIHDLENGPIYRHGASFVRGVIHKEFLFDLSKIPQIKYALDFDVIFRLYKSAKKFRRIDKFILNYEKEGISNNPILNRIYIYKITSEYRFSYIKFKYMVKSIYNIKKRTFKNRIKSFLK